MAQRTKTQLKSLYGTSGTIFPDNATGEISESDMRAFGEDVADSLPFKTGDSISQDLYIPSSGMWPRITNGPSQGQSEMATSLVNIVSLDFDQTTQEFADFTIVFPRNYNNGTITAKIYWTASGGSGDVIWQVSGGAYSNDDALTTALGTGQSVTDTLISAGDVHITNYTSAITLGGTPADADFIVLRISRDAGNVSDTLTADAKLLGIVITLSTDGMEAS